MSSKAKQKNIKKKSNSFTETLKDNRVYLLCIFIIISVSLICLLIANRYPFGDLPAIKGDGMEQLFTKHVANISEIKKHGLPYYYNFNSGGFYSMFAYRIYDITHPWLIFKYFFTGKSLILLDYTCSWKLAVLLPGPCHLQEDHLASYANPRPYHGPAQQQAHRRPSGPLPTYDRPSSAGAPYRNIQNHTLSAAAVRHARAAVNPSQPVSGAAPASVPGPSQR